MKTIPAREAKNHFGMLLDTAQREPVRITKNNRPVAVVLSGDEYEAYAMTQQERQAAQNSALQRLASLPTLKELKGLSEKEILALVNREINASRQQ